MPSFRWSHAVVAVSAALVVWTGCQCGPLPPASFDGGTPDAFVPGDAGPGADAGPDAGADAGQDGGADAGVTDGGADAGLPWRVVVGGVGTCALSERGRVKCWGGLQSYERLGFKGDDGGEMGDALPFVNLGTGRTAKQLALGSSHACAVLDNDQLKCWGYNQYGQLGLGDRKDRGARSGDMGDGLPYVQLGLQRTVREVAAGSDHTCARLDGDEVKCWGQNGAGQLGLGDNRSRGTDAGDMGDALPVVRLGTFRTARRLFCGDGRSCALLDDGALKCWGNASYGALGLGPLSQHLGVDAGDMGDALAAVALGTGLTAADVAVGGDFTCARFADGTSKCWGSNSVGQLAQGDLRTRGDDANEMGDNLPLNGVPAPLVSLAAGASHACGVRLGGQTMCWGGNYKGTLGLGLPDNATVGGRPSELGFNLPRVDLGGPAVAVSSKGLHSCATLEDGRVKCWGMNSLGQLGLGDTRDRGNDVNDMGVLLPAVELGAP